MYKGNEETVIPKITNSFSDSSSKSYSFSNSKANSKSRLNILCSHREVNKNDLHFEPLNESEISKE